MRYFVSTFVATALFALMSVSVLHAYDNGIVPVNTPASARRMINDLVETYGKQYPQGAQFLRRLDAIEKSSKIDQGALDALIREAALANPLLDFDKILCVRRKPTKNGREGFLGLNSHCEDDLQRTGWDNEISILSNLRGTPKLTPLHRQPNGAIMRDLDLHFDGNRFLFASVNAKGNLGVFEMGVDGSGLRELTPSDQRDVQWFDPCYLPEEGVILSFSTAGVQGVPCEGGGPKVASLYRVDTREKTASGAPKVRQLTFEQDSGWHPRTLNDGRAMYLRWQYTDTPHYFDRLLFSMLPDGRQQKALWGSGAYFPTAFKHGRPVPGRSSMILGVVSSHHGMSERGRLMLIDPNLGTHYPFRHDPESKEWGPSGAPLNILPRIYPKEVTGCVQEIPGWGRDVVGNVLDNQGGLGKYIYTTPYPLSEKYYLASIWVGRKGRYGLWLVDKFDNMVKLCELPDSNLFEPVPIVPRKRPPVIPDVTQPEATEGTMLVTDVYDGRGLPKIPRGKAKALRIIAYHFAYWGRGGHNVIGEESSWDVKRVLGTVPVEADGSAFFKVPANTPLAIQILDEDGAAIQLMQSWTITMPGESLSCTGCHEKSNLSLPGQFYSIASRKSPRSITPWYGPERPFAFQTEIQPLLNKHCIHCHNDTNKKAVAPKRFLSFTPHRTGSWRTDTAYNALHPFVRRPGPESNIETKVPMDFHASTSELIQRLRKGHYSVKLDREAWERLYTWIDLNAPYRGSWDAPQWEKRRVELQALYGGNTANPEAVFREQLARVTANPVKSPPPVPAETIKKLLAQTTRAFSTHAIAKPAATPALATPAPAVVNRPTRTVKLPNGQTIRFVHIPAGLLTIGSTDGFSDERPLATVHVKKPFWMAETELTNAQYAAYDPDHDTGYAHENGKDHVAPGYIANHPNQPVARVSWQEAMKYCEWLSKQTGKKATLPTEAQWEWAARAGTKTTFYFGDRQANFSEHANLADASLRKTRHNFRGGSRIPARENFPVNYPYPLRDDRFADKWFSVDYVKQNAANPWGLYDIIGNVWEWTRSDYAPYPYNENDGRNNNNLDKKKVARGGSHTDRPETVGSAARIPYESYQKVHNVGFRPIIEDDDSTLPQPAGTIAANK